MKKLRLGAVAAAFGIPAVGLVAVGLIGACSSKVDDPPGAIMVAIDTDLNVPDDLDQVGIAARIADEDGGEGFENNVFGLKPLLEGNVLPATFAIVRGTDRPIQIRVVGYKGTQAVTVRDAITTIPASGTSLLRMDIEWLDKGTAVAPPSTASSAAQVDETPLPLTFSSTCGALATSVAGTCQGLNFPVLDQEVDGGLPPFTPASIVSSAATGCFSVDDCFAGFSNGAADVKVTAAKDASGNVTACSFAQTTTADMINVGLRLADGNDGWCDGVGCVIPLVRDRSFGWYVDETGLIQLPVSVCTNSTILGVTVSKTSATCPQKLHGTAACQSYVADDGGVDDNDASATSPADGSVDDAALDAGIDEATHTYDFGDGAALKALTADSVHTYTVEQYSGSGLSLTVAPANFEAQSVNQTSPLAYLGDPSDVPQVSANAPFVAVHGDDGFQVVNVSGTALTDGGTFDDMAVGADLTAFTFAGQPRYLVAACRGGLCATTTNGAIESFDGGLVASLALDPATATSSNPQFAAATFSGTSQLITYGPFSDSNGLAGDLTLTTLTTTQVTELAFPNSAYVAWIDTTGDVCYTARVASTAHTCFGTGALTSAAALVAGNDAIYWIDATSHGVNRVAFTTADPPAASSGNGTALTALGSNVQSLALVGNELYWISGSTVSRRDVRSIP